MTFKDLLALAAWGWVCLGMNPTLHGQKPMQQPTDSPAPSAGPAQELNKKLFSGRNSPLVPLRQDYRLGPGDVVEISVFDVKELNRTLEISAHGKITLPFVNEVTAEGLTAQQLERRLAALLEEQVMKNPQVTVSIKEYRSQPIHVLGAVQKPGTYQLVRHLRLIDALSLAGGFSEKAGDRIFLRKAPAGSQASGGMPASDPANLLEIDIQSLLVTGDPRLNYPVDAGDVISVPQKVDKLYYVLGDVGKPGAYEFKDKEDDVRLSQALATAGGLLRTAASKAVTVVRQEASGKKSYIPVNVALVLQGKGNDLVLKPNDLVFVPNSAGKNAAQSLMNGLASIVTGGLLVIR